MTLVSDIALEPLTLNRDAAITIHEALNDVLNSALELSDAKVDALEGLAAALEFRLGMQELEFDALHGPEPFADLDDA